MLEGFGGVSEYGITVRWDKNFLTLIHLTLARRDKLRIYGGIRFGGTLPIDEAWAHGFDHIAIAAGAGRPTIIDMKNNLMRGIRKASDFLMALQLTGAFKNGALPNLQARLPAVVIGGGLTGIDTATELFAYYPIQVEKTLDRYEALVAELGEARGARHDATPEEQAILDEFLAHGRAVRAERAARRGGRRAAELRAAGARLGRRDAGLPQAHGGLAGLPPEPRGSDQGARGGHLRSPRTSTPLEIVADEFGHVKAMVFKRPNGRASSCPRGRCSWRPARRRTSPTRRNSPARSSSTSKRKFFQGFRAEGSGSTAVSLDAGSERLLHVATTTTASSSRTTATTTRATTATSSRRWRRPSTAIAHVVALFADDIAALDRRPAAGARAAWTRWSPSSTMSCWRASSGSCG